MKQCLTSEVTQVEHMRNIAVVAHVDHGKTTLVDQLLRQSGTAVATERLLDSIPLEMERGITIMSKITSINWGSYVLNIVDTPGHQDFGGEVERVLGIVDGVLLLVDASEGPMPQTKYVLSKALSHGLQPIVVVNKVDRATARLDGQVEDDVFELFCALDANDRQLSFPVLYASAKEGWCVSDLTEPHENIQALYQAIVDYVPPPKVDTSLTFSMLVASAEYDNYVGPIVSGKVYSGTAKPGDKVKAITRDGQLVGEGKIFKVFRRRGLDREEIAEATCGDIVSVAGTKANISDTLCSISHDVPIPTDPIDPPTIGMTFSVNDSPLQGKYGGTKMTSNQIKDRVLKEAEKNVSLKVIMAEDSDSCEVHGRGELQLSILIEQMRREGFELTLTPPRVLTRKGANGKEEEPWEEVTVDMPAIHTGLVIGRLQERGAQTVHYKQDKEDVRAVFLVPSSGLMGFRSEMKQLAGGSVIINSIVHGYRPVGLAPNNRRSKGKLVSMANGVATSYALKDVEERGVVMIKPGDEVYQGMVVGESSREHDIEVNPTRTKKVTNLRAAGNDEFYKLTPPKLMSLEECVAYLSGDTDHQLEVTPRAIRMRRKNLSGKKRRS